MVEIELEDLETLLSFATDHCEQECGLSGSGIDFEENELCGDCSIREMIDRLEKII